MKNINFHANNFETKSKRFVTTMLTKIGIQQSIFHNCSKTCPDYLSYTCSNMEAFTHTRSGGGSTTMLQ